MRYIARAAVIVVAIPFVAVGLAAAALYSFIVGGWLLYVAFHEWLLK